MTITIRKLLDSKGFNWKNGVIVMPSINGIQNLMIEPDHEILDEEVSLNWRDPDQDFNRCPVFSAEDDEKVYVTCMRPDLKMASFHSVSKDRVEDVEINGIRGYLQGPEFPGMDLGFNPPLSVFVSKKEESPAFVGWSDVHLYCVSETLRGAMERFTHQILSLYVTSVKGNGNKGYLGLVRNILGLYDITETKIGPQVS